MNPVDLSIFVVYVLGLLGIGYYFHKKNRGGEDFYVGGRDISSLHIGLSVVATDVGGGFSIGLGGLGFVMGLSGSWMLFTGLMGAWLAAVFLIPKVKSNPAFANAYTFPDVFSHFYNRRVALVAGLISAVGYAGFTSSQLLAGAKLATGTFAGVDQNTALVMMGLIVVIYTVMGGLKAVIFTDTIQWIILMVGLILVGLPISYMAIGGIDGIRAAVDPEMLSLTNLTWQDIIYWGVTIIPIWFVGMTLYQRIYASRDVRTAKRAWFMAGLFEWPLMAFMGVLLGMFARVAADQGMFSYMDYSDASLMDPEIGLPLLLRTVLPVGFLGVMMAAYFSAILSTADSCLMASSGNIVSDIIGRFREMDPDSVSFVRYSQGVTLLIGIIGILLAWTMESVLDLMLYSYAFMVSGLFVPLIGALYWSGSTPKGALYAMIVGGSVTVGLQTAVETLPFGLDANVFGLSASFITFIVVSSLTSGENNGPKQKDSGYVEEKRSLTSDNPLS